MKLRQLQFVKAVADCSSFSKAAKSCNATQPTLSNSISLLEEELGGKLFIRTTRKVELTPFGDYLLPYLRAVLDARRELEKASEAYHNPVHRLLRIGFSPLVDIKLLNQVLEPYRQRHPDISIFYKECLVDDLEQRLTSDMIDIAIVPQGPQNPHESGFENHPFYSNSLFYLPSGEGPILPITGPIRLSSLPDTPVIMTGGGCGLNGSLKALFDGQGVKLRAYPGQAISYRAIEEWAELGIGAGILPAAKLSITREAAIPLLKNDGCPAVFSYDWIWKPPSNAQSPIGELLGYIKSTVPALISGSGSQGSELVQSSGESGK